MSETDKIFKDLYKEILLGGETREETRMYWKDGTPAYYRSIVGKQLVFKPENGFPILTSKFVPFKSLSTEILWIWAKRSNVVQELRDMGSKVWDEWELPDGTIGKAYGYQLANNYYYVPLNKVSEESWKAIGYDKIYGELAWYKKEQTTDKLKLNQVHYIIEQLIDNPTSRHLITMLWNVEDIPEMSLPPCVYETQWIIYKNRLELFVGQRSVDTMLGLPYNVSQYGLLHRMIAKITGYEIGNMTFRMGDIHLYDRHIPVAKEFIQRKEYLAPELWLSDDVLLEGMEFNKTFGLIDYKNNLGNAGKLETEVSITKAELDRLKG